MDTIWPIWIKKNILLKYVGILRDDKSYVRRIGNEDHSVVCEYQNIIFIFNQ